MRAFLRQLASAYAGRLRLVAWAAMVAVSVLAWTEPRHGANSVIFWAAVGVWAAAFLGAAAIDWRDTRRLRKEEKALSLDTMAMYEALNSAMQARAAAQAFASPVVCDDAERPTSPLDKSVPAEPRTDPIVGYRLWCIEDGKLYPVGAANAGPWVPGENVAEDFSRDMACARPGFWALRSVDAAVAASQEYPAAEVIGVVELYGRVVEQELGWRAEKARILAVVGLPSVGYGIDVYVERAQEWTVQETIMGEQGEAQEEFMERYPDAALYSPKGTAYPVFVLRMGTSLSCCGVERMVPLEGVEPFDAAPVGRRYGVPAFGSLEGLRAFAREMGAEE